MSPRRDPAARLRLALRRARALPRLGEESHAGIEQVSRRTAALDERLDERAAAAAAHAEVTDAQARELSAAVAALRDGHADLIGEVRALRAEVAELRAVAVEGIEAAVEDEAGTRRLLRAAREAPGYAAAWTDAEPLVSIVVPTFDQWRDLERRALPSALAQQYGAIEVVVVGDGAPPETAAAIARIGDARVRYENLPLQGSYPDDSRRRWFVAGTAAFNRALELACGSWIVVLNDDDALRPDLVPRLLEQARSSGAEVAYGQFVQHEPGGAETTIGAVPPTQHRFAWQGALQHRALTLFEWKLAAATFDRPGDWDRVRRMRRAGVTFSYLDAVVCDYYPGSLWREAG